MKKISYHRAWVPVFLGLGAVVAFELIAFQFLFARWSWWLNLVHGVMSVWAAGWTFGHYRSMVRNPIISHDDRLLLRLGTWWNVEIKREDIESIEIDPDTDPTNPLKDMLNLGAMGQMNVLIKLKRVYETKGPMKRSQRFDKVALTVDEARDLKI